ncbi:hypothetical protein TNCV_2977221 [Trichonephila clavipes]|nr:hypothetical protein TNCV_2977221 [Trichonephila clavipes]
MHRDENLPWRVVCPQPWKWALETHVERSIRTLWPMGCPLTSLIKCKGKPIKLSIDTIPNDPQVITANHLHEMRSMNVWFTPRYPWNTYPFSEVGEVIWNILNRWFVMPIYSIKEVSGYFTDSLSNSGDFKVSSKIDISHIPVGIENLSCNNILEAFKKINIGSCCMAPNWCGIS